MKKILIVLLTLFSLFLQAQDPKPIPYNAKFLGYVQVNSLKDASAQTATMGYVLADTLTGQLYLVTAPTMTDTGKVTTTGSGQKIYQQLELLNTSLIQNQNGEFTIKDVASGTTTITTNGGGDFIISDRSSGNATLLTNGEGDLYVKDKVSNDTTLNLSNAGQLIIIPRGNADTTFYQAGATLWNNTTNSPNSSITNSPVSAIYSSANSYIDGGQTNDIIGGYQSKIFSNSSRSLIFGGQNSSISGGNATVLINGDAHNITLTSATAIGKDLYLLDNAYNGAYDKVLIIDTVTKKVWRINLVGLIAKDTNLVRTTGIGEKVYQSLELLNGLDIKNDLLVSSGTVIPSITLNNSGVSGKACALATGTSSSVFAYDQNGVFAVQSRSKADILAGSFLATDNKFVVNSSGVGIGINVTPDNAVSFYGNSNNVISNQRNTTTGEGGSLTIGGSGGAKSNETSTNGADIHIKQQYTTGNGRSEVTISARRRYKDASKKTTDNVLVERFIVASEKPMTDNTNDTLFSIPLTAGQLSNGVIKYGLLCVDGTDLQSESGTINWAVVNKGGVLIASVVPSYTQALSTGTLTNYISSTLLSLNSNVLYFIVKWDSSINPSTDQLKFNAVYFFGGTTNPTFY